MRYFSIILITFLSVHFVSAQGISDAVRYSNYEPIGTARTLGVGSAFGAMGGDFSVIGINPAGIAEYRIGELNFTPSIVSSNTNAFFVDDIQNSRRSRSNFLLDNIGFVGATDTRASRWQTSNWAVGFSKLANFNRNVNILGETEGSITERFIERANGNSLDDLDGFEAGPAYDAGAIFEDGSQNYVSDYLEDDVVRKEQFIDQKGSINELTIGWAGNYDNQINIGISAGIPFVSFTETKTYKEGVTDGDFSNELEYVERLNTSGAGFNLKFGVQYKAMRKLRIGAAIHSPTWYTLNDDYSTQVNYEFTSTDESFQGQGMSPDGSFKYKFTNPWKAVGSIGSIYKIGEIQGFVSADFEFLDYTNNEFDFTAYSNDPGEASFTQEVNSEIDNQLGSATNIRLGSEMAFGSLRVRVGYSISTSPYISDSDTYSSISAGLGFRADKFFFDVGYRRQEIQEGYNPYVVLEQSNRDPLANIETEIGRLAMTIGFKF
ncbi:MAG: hypothetical protein P1U56_03690 [Saprospiraceae bacterium]|nr:hypothetical protein [Saprospiraceae bacterium]